MRAWKNMTQNVQMRILRNVLSHVYIKAGRLIIKTLIIQLMLTCFHTSVGVCIFQVFYDEHVLLQSDF